MILKSLLILPIITFCSISSQAALTIHSISGTSAYDLSTPTSPIVFGGTAGTACTSSISETCNNCTSAGTACNPHRIHDDLNLTFNISSNTIKGKGVITNSTGEAPIGSAYTTVYAENTTIAISVAWSSLCNALNSSASTCETSGFNQTLRVGISKDTEESPANTNLTDSADEYISVTIRVHGNNDTAGSGTGNTHASPCNTATSTDEGLCEVTFTKGDEKVYAIAAEALSGFPNSSNEIQYKKMRVMFSTSTDDASFAVEGDNIRDLDISADSTTSVSFNDNMVTGLQNGVSYYIKFGIIDQAGNIGWFSPTALGPYTPEEVYGLLTEDVNCFIATAAYGSSMAPKVKTFREFRNKYLLNNKFGQRFVRLYYKYSPPFAAIIKQNRWLKILTQLALWPLWVIATVALHWGSSFNLIFLIVPFCVVFLCLSHYSNIWARRKIK